MRRHTLVVFGELIAVLAFGPVACEKSSSKPESRETAGNAQAVPKPADDPLHRPQDHNAASKGAKALTLTGIRFEVPEGWRQEAAPPSPMAPKAVFALESTEGDETECSVRITYFPGMKGKDDMNIDRWLSQVKHDDGSPSTRKDARVDVLELGAVQVTAVDVTGVVSASMGMGGPSTDTAKQRMIAAIVDHPKGPHFVKAVGSVATMKKWQASIEAFLKSARVE